MSAKVAVLPWHDEGDLITRGAALNAVRDIMLQSASLEGLQRAVVQRHLRETLVLIWSAEPANPTLHP